MADKIVVMHDGRVEQIGRPLDLYDRPENLFVAGFIGSPGMNMLKGELTGDGFAAGGLVMPLRNAPQASQGRPAIYGIRPEGLRMTGGGGMPLEVVVVEPTGSETHVAGRLAGQEVTCVFRDRVEATAGQTIHVEADPGHAHLFDPQTGRRLN